MGDADNWADRLHERVAAPALCVAVADAGGEVLWQAARGMADIELGVAAQPGHSFRVGSVSKVVTATLAARLAVRDGLDLDAPIAYWLPDLPPHHRKTTLRQLLTHRGGVRHYLPKDLDPRQPGGPLFSRPHWTAEDILAAFIDDPLVGPPGGAVQYSSWGYSLASLAIQAAAGGPFLELVESEIARPFGLPTLVPDIPGKVVPGRVRGYAGREEVERLRAQFPDAGFAAVTDDWVNAPPLNPAYCWAGAGFLMSAPDMARFGAAQLEGPGSRITAAERALQFTPVTEKCDASPPLGLGWRVDADERGRLRWHHAGATPGGRAGLVVYPAEGLAVAILANTMTASGDVLGPAAELADIFTP